MAEIKVKIDDDGYLWIKRGSELKAQYCPHPDKEACGDWCPLFDVRDWGEKTKAITFCGNVSRLCEKEHFSDERE